MNRKEKDPFTYDDPKEGEGRTKRLHMLLPEEEWSRLKELSERRNTSVSDLIRSAYQDMYWPRTRLASLQVLGRWKDNPPLDEKAASDIRSGLI
ncbi:MAG: hypothetical protein KDK23_07890 [Leptospiraceae bacterium]|nr:hypothetical protein [Leptospiraceae bacterium]